MHNTHLPLTQALINLKEQQELSENQVIFKLKIYDKLDQSSKVIFGCLSSIQEILSNKNEYPRRQVVSQMAFFISNIFQLQLQLYFCELPLSHIVNIHMYINTTDFYFIYTKNIETNIVTKNIRKCIFKSNGYVNVHF